MSCNQLKLAKTYKLGMRIAISCMLAYYAIVANVLSIAIATAFLLTQLRKYLTRFVRLED